MPDIKLGPSGTETTLPAINWMAGGDLGLPIGYKKNVEKSMAINGKTVVNIKPNHQKTWVLDWEYLTASEILTIQGLAEQNAALHFQPNQVDATWYWVWVVSLEVDPIQSTHATTIHFRATLTLEETD